MAADRRIFKLEGVIQHYSWGGYDFIPQLLGIENRERQPFAEYWMGAHTNHPALIENGSKIALNEFIAANAKEILGDSICKKFGSLPFLLKVLDVRQMLSIQVHPSKEAAAKSFEEENKRNIPVKAAHRNYKDQNHKPELMVALSDFWLLHGFKNEEKLIPIFEEHKELGFLKNSFISGGYKKMYQEVMLMDQPKINELLHPLLERITTLYNNGSLSKDHEDFWAARAVQNFNKGHNYDRGIFSIYLFNLVHLKKGEGIYQPSGLPHAYLEGRNVEIMANSDNVLRAGLTDKHIDVPELLKHVKFETTIPKILKPQSHHSIFFAPAEEFELQEYSLSPGEQANIQTRTGEVLLLIEGSLKIGFENDQLEIHKGESLFVKAGTELKLIPQSEINLFRATVPG